VATAGVSSAQRMTAEVFWMISKLRQKCRVALVQVDIVGVCPSGAEADCLSDYKRGCLGFRLPYVSEAASGKGERSEGCTSEARKPGEHT
jgi:hypothetical protein